MFHPHFLRLFFGIPHSTAEAMAFVAASKVEEDLQQARREERGSKDGPRLNVFLRVEESCRFSVGGE